MKLHKVKVTAIVVLAALGMTAGSADARVVRLKIDKREIVAGEQTFGAAGQYEKLVGTVEFAVDPTLPQNQLVLDLPLAPKNAQGEVEFSADFYMIKPVDPAKSNGRILFEIGNRGGKGALVTFQKAKGSPDPTTAEEFGDGALMHQGYSIMWLGWQFDVPDGRMRMEIPIATDNGQPIRGVIRGNWIGNGQSTAPVADRNHKPYPPVDPDNPSYVLTVRNLPWEKGQPVPRSKWRFTGPGTVTIDGVFEWGKIYDVVYTTESPRVIGLGLAGPRDLVSYFKHASAAEGNPLPGVKTVIGWGTSQTGRYLRHFVYQGFNEDERGERVFDGLIDERGGAGRGSFNHRFGQASRDALQHFNIQYPVDMFPFSDGHQKDPVNGTEDGLLDRAVAKNVVPKFFHVLSNSEYFNRGGSLIHTDTSGTKDVEPPPTTRIYLISGAPHIRGQFPPAPNPDATFLGRADMNPLDTSPVIRALFRAMDRWVNDGIEPPPSRYPRFSDGTLAAPGKAGWPAIPLVKTHPAAPHTPHRLNYGPDFASKGLVTHEPPEVDQAFEVRVPAVDADGNDRAGIRLPDIAVPLATQTGWNYRHERIGASNQLSSEIGSYLAFPKTTEARKQAGDPRVSIAERYKSREEFIAKITAAANTLAEQRYILKEDVQAVVDQAGRHYDWATK